MNIVLVGPHGAGKTSLARCLSGRLGIPFHPELGRLLAEDTAWRPAGVTAHDGPVDVAERFDAELFRRELVRDARWCQGAHRPRLVETWHPGNLAYAWRRAPRVARRHLALIRARCRATPTVVLPVSAAPTTLARRQSEPGDLQAFISVGRAAVAEAERLGLRVLPTVHTDHLSPEALADALVPGLRTLLLPPPEPRSPTCASS